MEHWQVERHGPVAVARHDNPPMQYLDNTGVRELDELVGTWGHRDVRAVVLTGAAPGRFITHYDVEELVAYQRRDVAPTRTGRYIDGFHMLLQRLSGLAKPVIAAMNGDTMGAGLEISLACDLRIGQSGDFRYGFPEIKLGILPGSGGSQRLPRLIGVGAAVDFILRGRIVTPGEALELGLVHDVVDDATAHALELARELAAMPPVATAMIKRAIYDGSDLPLPFGLRVESDALLQTRLTRDAVTAMEHYVAVAPEQRRDYLERGELPEFEGA